VTPDAEARVRAAGERLIDELILAMQEQTPARDEPERLLTIEEARGRLGGISRSAFYDLMSRGAIRSVRAGSRRLIPSAAIAEFARTGEQTR